MKKFLPNLVLVLALALCALCVFQWLREARLRSEVASLQQTNQLQNQSLANAEALAGRYKVEITRLDTRVKELRQIEKTNSATVATFQINLRKAGLESESLRKQITGFKEAVERQNEGIKTQNEVIIRQNTSIKEQNETLKRLAIERDDLVARLNARTKEFNDAAANYNDLVQQLERLRNKGGGK